jgi:hypothetical protein
MEEAGVSVTDETPGCTTTEEKKSACTGPIYGVEGVQLPEVVLCFPLKLPVLSCTVSIVKYAEEDGLVNANVLEVVIFSPIDPVPYNCSAVYVAI